MKHLNKQFRIIKVRAKKPWQVQKRHKLLFWKDVGVNCATFEEAKEEVAKLKSIKKNK